MHGRAGLEPTLTILPWSDELLEIVRCPRCQGTVHGGGGAQLRCSACEIDFPVVDGQPALIDFAASIVDEADVLDSRDNADCRTAKRGRLGGRIRRALVGRNEAARRAVPQFVKQARRVSPRPRILVVGGGQIGSGADELYSTPGIDIVGTDIYASRYTALLADGHQLPFASGVFDGVWIQAVLEHVLEPQRVVDEIVRVLRPGGVVFADSPFLYPVHEGAYDFTRFTLSGHRWLFRHFRTLDAGASAGAGSAMVWQIGWLLKSLLGHKIGAAGALLFFWLRFLDRIASPRPNADAASGVFFFGSKMERPIRPKDMIRFYEEQQLLLGRDRHRPAWSVRAAERLIDAIGWAWRRLPHRAVHTEAGFRKSGGPTK